MVVDWVCVEMEIDVICITRVLLYAKMYCFVGQTHEHSSFFFGRVSTMSTMLPLLDKKTQYIWTLQMEKLYVLICIQSGEVSSDHKWSLRTHVETLLSRCEPMYSELSTGDRLSQDTWRYTVCSICVSSLLLIVL